MWDKGGIKGEVHPSRSESEKRDGEKRQGCAQKDAVGRAESENGKARAPSDAVASCLHAVCRMDAVFQRPGDHDGKDADLCADLIDEGAVPIKSKRSLAFSDAFHASAEEGHVTKRHGEQECKLCGKSAEIDELPLIL